MKLLKGKENAHFDVDDDGEEEWKSRKCNVIRWDLE